MVSSVDAHLEIDPENVIEFVHLDDSEDAAAATTSSSSSSLTTLTLKNPDVDGLPIAFKVKTTQPRRYLVRPNQGLILPGQSEIIQIVLVDKDKQELMKSYHAMGDVVLEQNWNKDKFLLQSMAIVTPSTSATSSSSSEPLNLSYEAITELWSNRSSGGTGTGSGTANTTTTITTSSNHNGTTLQTSAIANKKLHVRHSMATTTTTSNVINGTTPTTTNRSISSTNAIHNNNNNNRAPPVSSQPALAVANMSRDQLIVEVTKIRDKYDELIAFSVNLTAERDLISNTLEVSKRDLQRLLKETNSSNSRGFNKRGSGGGHSDGTTGSTTATKKSSTSLSFLVVVLVLMMMMLSFMSGIVYVVLQPNDDTDATTLPAIVRSHLQRMIPPQYLPTSMSSSSSSSEMDDVTATTSTSTTGTTSEEL